MKYVYAITLLLCCFNIRSQQITSTIRGTVTDIENQQPLIGATVTLIDSTLSIGDVTNNEGTFHLNNVPVGRRSISVSYLGYTPVVIPDIILTSAKEIVLNVSLQEQVINTKEITITAHANGETNNDMVSISGRSFTNEETNRYAGSRADPSRMVANYAGVLAANDSRNDILVRGNSPFGVLWRLEEIDIPNPNHFSGQGATGGPMSILNNNLLSSSDFLTGAFPAEYGNKIAAAFDLKLRNGNNEKQEFIGQFGINGIELAAEGPFSKKNKSSYLFSYRYSTFKLFNALGINFGVTGIPVYQDICFKTVFSVNQKNTISFFGIGGISDMAILSSKRDSSDWNFTSSGEDIHYGSGMGVAGMHYTHFFNTNTFGKFTVAFAAEHIGVQVDTIISASENSRTFTNNSLDESLQFDYKFNHKISSKDLFKVGVNYKFLFFDYHESFFAHQYDTTINIILDSGSTSLLQTFAEWQHHFNARLTLNGGIHFQYFLFNQSQSIEPRVGIRFQATENHLFSFAYGLHSQMQPLVIYFNSTYIDSLQTYHQTNHQLGFTKAHHFIIGWQFSFKKDFRFKTECYYQHLFNAPVEGGHLSTYSILNLGGDYNFPMRDSLMNSGTGNNLGAELTFEKLFSHHYYFLTTASIFHSTYTGSNGVVHNTKFDNRYVVNVLAGYEFILGKKKNNAASVDARFTRAGGLRYTPIDLAASQAQLQEIRDFNFAYSMQYPDYSRVDLKAEYKINSLKITQHFIVVCENIFNTKNIMQQFYEPNTGKIHTDYQLGLFPYAAYRIEF